MLAGIFQFSIHLSILNLCNGKIWTSTKVRRYKTSINGNGNLHLNEIAETGQYSTQTPQPVHLSLSICAILPTVIALSGHTL
jgi:hypothetical protein